MAKYTFKFGILTVGNEVIVPSLEHRQDGPRVEGGFLHDRALVINNSPAGSLRVTFVLTQTENTIEELLQWWHSMVQNLGAAGSQNGKLLKDGSTKVTFPGYHFEGLDMPEPRSPSRMRYTWDTRLTIVGSSPWEFS